MQGTTKLEKRSLGTPLINPGVCLKEFDHQNKRLICSLQPIEFLLVCSVLNLAKQANQLFITVRKTTLDWFTRIAALDVSRAHLNWPRFDLTNHQLDARSNFITLAPDRASPIRLKVRSATASAAASSTASALWTYLLVIVRPLCPTNAAIVGSE